MDGFWSHAFDSLEDNVDLFFAAVEDLSDNLNPLSDQFLSGDARNTATEVERQIARDEVREVDPARIERSAAGGLGTLRDAAEGTAAEIKAAAGETLDTTAQVVGGVLDALTNPWVLGTIGLVVVGVLVAPYAVPAFKAVAS